MSTGPSSQRDSCKLTRNTWAGNGWPTSRWKPVFLLQHSFQQQAPLQLPLQVPMRKPSLVGSSWIWVGFQKFDDSGKGNLSQVGYIFPFPLFVDREDSLKVIGRIPTKVYPPWNLQCYSSCKIDSWKTTFLFSFVCLRWFLTPYHGKSM